MMSLSSLPDLKRSDFELSEVDLRDLDFADLERFAADHGGPDAAPRARSESDIPEAFSLPELPADLYLSYPDPPRTPRQRILVLKLALSEWRARLTPSFNLRIALVAALVGAGLGVGVTGLWTTMAAPDRPVIAAATQQRIEKLEDRVELSRDQLSEQRTNARERRRKAVRVAVKRAIARERGAVIDNSASY
jgi:hypothetical protein